MSVNTLIFNHCHNKDFYFAIRLVCLVKGKLARVKRHSQKYSKQSLIFTTQWNCNVMKITFIILQLKQMSVYFRSKQTVYFQTSEVWTTFQTV